MSNPISLEYTRILEGEIQMDTNHIVYKSHNQDSKCQFAFFLKRHQTFAPAVSARLHGLVTDPSPVSSHSIYALLSSKNQ